MRYTKLIQQYKDADEIQCPECFDDLCEANLKKTVEGMVMRKCSRGHEWLDSITIKEWRTIKRMNGAHEKGNLNQYTKAKPSTLDTRDHPL